jgi:hypothetical protein
MTAKLDAAAGRRLSGNGEVWLPNKDVRLQGDGTSDPENDRPRSGLTDSISKAARPGVVQVRHLDDAAATAAHGLRPAALRAREGRHGGTRERGREYKREYKKAR